MVVVDLDCADAGDCEPMAVALEQFTPLAEALRPGLYAFGARGPSRYFGGERALVALVAQAAPEAVPSAARIGVGVADGLFAASLAARTAARTPATSALKGTSARRSDDKHSGAAAVLVVPPQQGRHFLAEMPLTSLAEGISPLCSAENGAEALLDVLWRLGIRTLGDLAALSEADMMGRFGWPGLVAHRLASGLDDCPLRAEAVGDDASAETEIDPPADRIETVAFAARALADDMVARLARNGLDCVCVDIEASSDSGHASSRRWRHEFRFSAVAVVDRVRWQLEGWYRSSERPTGPITFIRLTPCEVAPSDGRQLGMWGARSEADERAAKALARVQGLLGAEAVTGPHLAGGRRPVDIGRRVPLHAAETESTPEKGRKVKAAKAPWPGRLPAPSPAVVLAQPEPVEITDGDGTPVAVSGRGETSTPPQRFTDSTGRSRAVTAWAGPWPLDERWWHPSARRRQARFQLVLDDGSAHLCVLENGRWQREATYD